MCRRYEVVNFLATGVVAVMVVRAVLLYFVRARY